MTAGRIETAAHFDEAALALASLTPSTHRLSPSPFLHTAREVDSYRNVIHCAEKRRAIDGGNRFRRSAADVCQPG